MLASESVKTVMDGVEVDRTLQEFSVASWSVRVYIIPARLFSYPREQGHPVHARRSVTPRHTYMQRDILMLKQANAMCNIIAQQLAPQTSRCG